MQYVRLCEGLKKYTLIPANENIFDHIKSVDKDHYVSIFQYNEDQYNLWKKTKSVAGIKEVTTNKLVFDFDDASNPEAAKEDTLTLTSRLLSKGIKSDEILVSFSGNKGFCVEVKTSDIFTQEEFKNITLALAGDLKTFDKVVNDPQRVIRVVGTKHQKSGLYKCPINIDDLSNLSIDQIKNLSSSFENINDELINNVKEVSLPASIGSLRFSKTKEKTKKDGNFDVSDFNPKLKPKWMSEAKYALQEGFFGAGERNHAFMILAATYKAQRFPLELTYRMLKGVAEIQARRNGVDRYSDEELYNNICRVVYSDSWRGAQYSTETDSLLLEVAERMGLKKDRGSEDNALIGVDDFASTFKKFAVNIDQNTIKLGIKEVDDNIRITTSMVVGLLAGPSAGKSSISFGVLNFNSLAALNPIFFSLDMGAPLVYQRLIQRHTGLQGEKIFKLYKESDPKVSELEEAVRTNYENVRFCFKTGITTEDIREYILQTEETTGEKTKLVVIDYLECITGPYSDPTANSALIANQLKDIANELDVCVLLLLQPQKMAGDPSEPLLSMRNVKGSSVIEQACSIILTMWRPGFSPETPEDDRYLSIAAVKNRMGQLNVFDLSWDGLTGKVDSLDYLEKEELQSIKKRVQARKAEKDGI